MFYGILGVYWWNGLKGRIIKLRELSQEVDRKKQEGKGMKMNICQNVFRGW